MAFWRRIWQRGQDGSLAACTALDVGTEFAKALVFEIDEHGHGTIKGVGRQRQGLSHMWDVNHGDSAVVGVVDTGADAGHPELGPKLNAAVDQAQIETRSYRRGVGNLFLTTQPNAKVRKLDPMPAIPRR